MNWKKFFIVVQREYLSRVKKKSFLIFTLLTPLLFIVLATVPTLLMIESSDTTGKTVMVLDQTGKYFDHLSGDSHIHYIKGNGTIADYRKSNVDSIYAYVHIKEDLLDNPSAITISSSKQITSDLEDNIRRDLEPVLREEKIRSFNIPNLDDIIRDANVTLNISSVRWDKSGKEKSNDAGFASFLGFGLTMLVYIFLTIYGSMVMQSVREEKKNRIVEVIISSIKPRVLLFGKVTAVGMVGLTQIIIWAVSLAIVFFVAQFFLLGSISMSNVEITNNINQSFDGAFTADDISSFIDPIFSINYLYIFSIFFIYFILGYFLYGSLYSACGAAADSDEDAQQLTLPMTLLIMTGFFIGMASMENPNSSMAIWGSMIPFTSPIVMMTRMPFDPPAWQIILSIVILIASTIGLVWIAEKIYQVGMLMYGKKPSFKDLWNWLRSK